MPYYTDAYLGIAMAYLDKDQIAEATEACANLLKIDPQDRRGYDCLGTLLVEQNRLPDALTVYKRGVQRNPKDDELWYGLGSTYEKSRMDKEAAEAFDKARRLRSAKIAAPTSSDFPLE